MVKQKQRATRKKRAKTRNMKRYLAVIYLMSFTLVNAAQDNLQREVDPFTKADIAYVEKNYVLMAKMSTNITIERAERLQTKEAVHYRMYMKVWLKSSFCFNNDAAIILLTQNDEQTSLSSNGLNCSTVKCGGGQCSHFIVVSPLLTPQEFFAFKGKIIKMVRLNTTDGYVNLEIDSERYRTNLSRLVENFAEFETQDLAKK